MLPRVDQWLDAYRLSLGTGGKGVTVREVHYTLPGRFNKRDGGIAEERRKLNSTVCVLDSKLVLV